MILGNVELSFQNGPQPAVDVLAVVWTAGDPFKDPAPNAIADWIAGYDESLRGRVREAMTTAGFSWSDGQRLIIPTGGLLSFSNLLLVGATPGTPRDWRGWRHVGRLVRHGLLEAEARRPGLLVERIFPTGLGELSEGLFAPIGPADSARFRSFTFTGGIAWTVHDRTAVAETVSRIQKTK